MIRVSGPDARSLVGSMFRGRRAESWVARQQHLGLILDSGNNPVDEVLVCYFPGPGSFTGEDVVEISCHGGVVVTKQILDAVLSAGAKPASPGEFTQRAFLNGRIDLTQAEAVMDLISAQTELAARAAREQLSGHLGGELESLRQALIALLAHMEAYIDFPEEDIDPDSQQELAERMSSIRSRVDALLSTADQGRILREGLRTVICGAPNAGKSSLLNRLLGFDRAIVNEAAGTTRDTIEEVINLKGIPIRLIDTAGIRESEEEIEREGIQRSRDQLAAAELILLVVDSSEGAERVEPIEIPDKAKVVRILNKSDLEPHPDWKGVEGLRISCLEPECAESIRDSLFEAVVNREGISTTSLTAINSRHQHCLEQARGALEQASNVLSAGESPEFVSLDLRAALDAIGDIIGKTDVEEILGEIFSTFCIGK